MWEDNMDESEPLETLREEVCEVSDGQRLLLLIGFLGLVLLIGLR